MCDKLPVSCRAVWCPIWGLQRVIGSISGMSQATGRFLVFVVVLYALVCSLQKQCDQVGVGEHLDTDRYPTVPQV